MISQILFVLVIFAAIGIVALVLMQQSKGDAGSAFGGGGGGGSQSMFGARGAANFLSRATSILVSVLFLGSLALAYSYSQLNRGERSILEEESVLDSSVEETGVPTIPGLESSTGNNALESNVPEIPSIEGSSDMNIPAPSADGQPSTQIQRSGDQSIEAINAAAVTAEANIIEKELSDAIENVSNDNSDAAIEMAEKLDEAISNDVEDVIEGDGIPSKEY